MFRHSLCLALVTLLLGACDAGSGLFGTRSDPAQWTIDAGALKLTVEESPWRMRFHDAAGREILAEHSATGPAPGGTLALFAGPPPEGAGALTLLTPMVRGNPAAPPQRASGWAHATRVIESGRDGAAWVATLATTDPLHTITLRAEAAGDGIIRLQARASLPALTQAMGIGFAAQDGERYLGFGERGNAVNQAGQVLEHYVGEGPYQNEEYLPIMAVVPKWGIRWRQDATYFPIPWLLSTRGYGVLVDNDELSYHRLASADHWSVEAESAELTLRVFAGPTPADVLNRFSAAVGRQPDNSAPWFFGPWVQADTDARIEEFRAADVPTSVAATYTHYLPCGDHQGAEDAQRARTARLQAAGTAVHTYFNPMICTDYQPAFDIAEAQDALIKDRLGQTYVYPYTTSSVFTVSQFDFSAPNGIAAYKALTDEALAHGYEGWMEDFGEYTPLDAVAADGATGTRFHNRYARDYHCGVATATADAGKPLARFVRSGWTGSARCSPIVWGGDPSTTFGFDGLESSIYQALSMGTSGVGLWGSDIGGFFALGFTALSPELLDRWIAFGGLSVIMRSQKDGIAIPDKTRPQIWDAAHLPVWRRYAKLHTQLYPYVQAAVDEYYATGMPVMRHHALSYPDDAEAMARDDQYLFGPDLLVAPVYVEGATTRELYLPAGRWIEFWRAVDYIESSGDFVLRTDAAVIEGGRSITVDAPITEIPIFVRAGAKIPLLPADVFTLADHGSDPGIVRLKDRANQIRVLEFPS
jgi:alpha-glucosidase (family GH31 glycosyl hydrolase)